MKLRDSKKVFVGMSGGVDSSVSAYLLKEEGYDVVGVHLRCWNRNGCDEREARDARLVANKLRIPFYVWDMEEEYKSRVVDYMVDGYRSGITPNPDVMCNKEIKFGLFLEKALAAGADFVATGHYAQVVKTPRGYRLSSGEDRAKDQSYFLWTLNQAQLAKTLFPVGRLKKKKVREIAKGAGLHVAQKKDSQGVCFVGQIDLQEFLAEELGTRRGAVLNTSGEVVGSHEGAHLYTIGQRHGLGVALNAPHYVAKKDTSTNTIVLARADEKILEGREVVIVGANIINPQAVSFKGPPLCVWVRLRYRQPLQKAFIQKVGVGSYKLEFESPVRFIAAGQSAVFYNDKEELIGGGIIA